MSGVISGRRLVDSLWCLCEKFWTLSYLDASEGYTIGCAATHCPYIPDMSSLCFSTEDIPTGRGRTLKTVGPAGTVPASSTGVLIRTCLNYFIFIIAFSSPFSVLRAQTFSQCTFMCASCCHVESHQIWRLSFIAWWDCRSATWWQHRWVQPLKEWPLSPKHCPIWDTLQHITDILMPSDLMNWSTTNICISPYFIFFLTH